MERYRSTVALLVALSFLALVKGQCYQKEGEPVHCCDQRGNEGPLVCCKGRNSSCTVEDPSEESVCFCDEFCYEAGDCCPDFEKAREECNLEGEFNNLTCCSRLLVFTEKLQIDELPYWAISRDDLWQNEHLSARLFSSSRFLSLLKSLLPLTIHCGMRPSGRSTPFVMLVIYLSTTFNLNAGEAHREVSSVFHTYASIVLLSYIELREGFSSGKPTRVIALPEIPYS